MGTDFQKHGYSVFKSGFGQAVYFFRGVLFLLHIFCDFPFFVVFGFGVPLPYNNRGTSAKMAVNLLIIPHCEISYGI